MTSLVLLVSVLASAVAAPLQDTLDNRLPSGNKDSRPVTVETEIVTANDETKHIYDKQVETKIDNNPSDSSSSTRNHMDPPEIKSDTSRSPKRHTETKEKSTKKTRKHKAIFVNYPILPQFRFPSLSQYDMDYNNDYEVEQRTSSGTNRYRQQESNIFYIRLPPTPYMFVPGLGYISQPPTYSTASLRPQIPFARPARPKPVYQQSVNPFINLPIDFVSNGKPTSVYQWQKKPSKKPTDSPITKLDGLSADFISNGKPTSIYQWQTNVKPLTRPDDLINNLDKGPYHFNGKPTSFFLLNSDGSTSAHQSIRYPDYRQDNSYYRV